MRPLSIAHVVHSIAREAAGTSISVVNLARALAMRGHDVSLHVIGDAPDVHGVRLRRYPPGLMTVAPSVGWSTPLLRGIVAEARRADIVHSHSCWLAPNIYPILVPVFGHARLVTSPRGTLSAAALRISRRKKQVAWHLAQKWALRATDALHATSQAEAEDVHRVLPGATVVVVPNCFEPPERIAASRTNTVLYLGRIHAHKGIDILLAAWRTIESAHPAWQLRIVGPDSDYTLELRRIASELGLARVSIESALYGADKARAYAEAGLFVLPSRSENFGMVVAEALAQETPVVASRNTPWEILETERCGRWTTLSTESLAAALHECMSLPPHEREAMGRRGRAWITRNLSMQRIAELMEREVYLPLVANKRAPLT